MPDFLCKHSSSSKKHRSQASKCWISCAVTTSRSKSHLSCNGTAARRQPDRAAMRRRCGELPGGLSSRRALLTWLIRAFMANSL